VPPRPKRKPKSTLKPETRAADDKLRAALQKADLAVLDRALAKAIKPASQRNG